MICNRSRFSLAICGQPGIPVPGPFRLAGKGRETVATENLLRLLFCSTVTSWLID